MLMPLLVQPTVDDSSAWGRLPSEERSSFVLDPNSQDPPFRLLLVGSGYIEVPPELAFLAAVYQNLEYSDFYAIIAEADIIVPAFAQYAYVSKLIFFIFICLPMHRTDYEAQASSTISLAVELEAQGLTFYFGTPANRIIPSQVPILQLNGCARYMVILMMSEQ